MNFCFVTRNYPRVPTVRESQEKSGNFEGVRENREGQGKVREF